MIEYILPHFGKLPTEKLEDYYYVNIEFNGSKIQFDLNFETETISKENFDNIKYFIENIESFDKQNINYIRNDFENDSEGTVNEYIAFHTEELGDEFLEENGIVGNRTDKDQQFLTKLHLIRVGLYPTEEQNKSNFAVFDYTIGEDMTNYLIVVKTDNKGNLDSLCCES